jgi:uncharacterized Zn finger protein
MAAGRGFDGDGWYPPSKPRAVTGGLKARTARGDIGSTWWSRRFLDVLESLAMGGRLTRGKTYARKGQVISLEIAPGEVRSSVQGSRARPYQVVIAFPVLSQLVWAKAEIALAEEALPTAKLLAGEVPPELEDIFAGAGAPLFPAAADDLGQRCSCPDWGVPCKHLAATFYLLAEAFDSDPFLILRWRGRDREELLSRLGQPGHHQVLAATDPVAGAPADADRRAGRDHPPAAGARRCARRASARRDDDGGVRALRRGLCPRRSTWPNSLIWWSARTGWPVRAGRRQSR